jgi:hypothetical protein
MAFFVHIGERCREDSRRHGLSSALDTFAESVEVAESLTLFDHFPPPYLVKKKLGGRQGRLIAAYYQTNDHVIIHFLAVMIRGDRAYEAFSADPIVYGQRNFEPKPDLNAIITDRLPDHRPTKRPAPDAAEYSFLYGHSGSAANAEGDVIVCESSRWIRTVNDNALRDRVAHLFEAVARTPYGDGDDHILAHPHRPGWGVLYRRFPHLQRILLISPLWPDLSPEDRKQIRRDHHELLSSAHVPLDLLLRHSKRAYPAIVLADEALWLSVEFDREGNMALSPEEAAILDAVRGGADTFPLFINGRAGSGKSTILQYLFADYLYSRLEIGHEQPGLWPLYFTCSDGLLRQSRQLVNTILRSSARWWADTDRLERIRQHDADIATSFREFHTFLHSLLPPGPRDDRFRRERHVDHARFRTLWGQRFDKVRGASLDYGADLSWHVIRSFVKGLTADEFIGPDEYRQLERKQRSVTQQSFERVHERVWEGWYQRQCEEYGYWDDQDLARFLVSEGLVRPTAPAIFCDEAQDFTRLELELLLRLSIFSERALDGPQLKRVPFAFAGDPFQTLNPTGFRWEATKAAFAEKFILGLDPTGKSGLTDLNYRELTYNYRSSRNIVGFGNLVQALRARLFDIGSARPQEAWEDEKHPPLVTWFDRNDDTFWEAFRRETDIVLIVPCAEGEELTFVKSDDVLTRTIVIEDGVPVNVLSAARAKGLEFARVAVYGFGHSAAPDLLQRAGRPSPYAEDPDASLPHEYFLNGLYVAVSRPKRRLFIVDSRAGLQRFWRFATDERALQDILAGLGDAAAKWMAAIAPMVQGNASDLSMDRASDPEENARNFEALGKSRRDSNLLRQAATAFRNAGREEKAIECRADALLFDGDFIEAGHQFLRIAQTDRAVDAFWSAGELGRHTLLRVAADRPDIAATIHYAFASFLGGRKTHQAGLAILEQLATRLEHSSFALRARTDNVWIESVTRVLRHLRELPEPDVSAVQSSAWHRIAAMCDLLQGKGFPLDSNEQAHIRFRVGDFPAALALWADAKDITSKEYKQALAQTLDYPQRLGPLFELGSYDEIVSAVESHPDITLPVDLARMAGLAFKGTRDWSGALTHLVQSRDPRELHALAMECLASPDLESVARRALCAALVLQATQADWQAIRDFIKTGAVLPQRPSQARLAEWLSQQKPSFDAALARALARSAALVDLPWDDRKARLTQRPIAEYLRTCFIQTDPRTWVHRISIEEIGAAVERAGSRVDGLSFYEAIKKATVAPHLKRFAEERWIACKERQAAFEIAQGRDRLGDTYSKEALAERAALGLPPTEGLAQFPPVSSLDELLVEIARVSTWPESVSSTPSPSDSPRREAVQFVSTPEPVFSAQAQRAYWSVGDLEFQYFRPQGRINVQHRVTGEMAVIRLREKVWYSADVESRTVEDDGRRIVCDKWALSLRFGEDNAGSHPEIEYFNLGIAIVLRSPDPKT